MPEASAELNMGADRAPIAEAPGEEPPRPVIHNDRARDELGWRPRPAAETIVETAQALIDLGLARIDAPGAR